MVIDLNQHISTSWAHGPTYVYDDVAPSTSSPEASEDLFIPEMDAYLGQVYALATQI